MVRVWVAGEQVEVAHAVEDGDDRRAGANRGHHVVHGHGRALHAFGSRFGHDPARAAVELAQELSPGR